MSGFYRKLVEEADRISNNSKNLFEQASGVEQVDEITEAKDKWMAKGPASGPGGGSRRKDSKGNVVSQTPENRKWEVATWCMDGVEDDLDIAIGDLNAPTSYPEEVGKAKAIYNKLSKLYDEAKRRYASKDYEWVITNCWKSRYIEHAMGVYDNQGQWTGPNWKPGRIGKLNDIGKLRLSGKSIKEGIEEAKKPTVSAKQQKANELVLDKEKAGYAQALKGWKQRIADKKREMKGLQDHIKWMEDQIPVAAAHAKKGKYHDAFMALWLDEFGF